MLPFQVPFIRYHSMLKAFLRTTYSLLNISKIVGGFDSVFNNQRNRRVAIKCAPHTQKP